MVGATCQPSAGEGVACTASRRPLLLLGRFREEATSRDRMAVRPRPHYRLTLL